VSLDPAQLWPRFHARSEDDDGRFLIGVRTTGIYCLPSCTARKPKPENVRFFEDQESARRAGLRPCKRCRPDRFYSHFDPDLERLVEQVGRLRRAPGEFADVAALAATGGWGLTKLAELVRRHYHATPADLIQGARVAHAARSLAGGSRRTLDVALDSGFESASTFHENFRARMGLTPAAYRRLGESDAFTVGLPRGYRLSDLVEPFRRDPEGRTERIEGLSFAKALPLAGRPCVLRGQAQARQVRFRVSVRARLPRAAMLEAHAAALRLLGLTLDPGPFERRVRRDADHARLIAGRVGLRVPLTASAFEGLCWVVVGQQVNVSFAATCRSRLIALAGECAPEGFRAHPTPAGVARLDYSDLTARQFSRSKAEFLIDAARAIEAGELELESLRERCAGGATQALGAVRGLGPWSVQYLLMRSLGFADCAPAGDSGLATALERFLTLDHRPDAVEVRRHMERFAPHRSLATFHLWRSLGDPS
jgi:AraC family transcriptional regulator of adaptative response / DNA-3-methyladenine glycosylase II